MPVVTHSPPVRTLNVIWLWKQHASCFSAGTFVGSAGVISRLDVLAVTGSAVVPG